jgi:hypothetical protein
VRGAVARACLEPSAVARRVCARASVVSAGN